MSSVTDNLKSPTFLAKILELALSSISTALFMAETYWLSTTMSKWAVLYGTLIGFIMISIIIIITTILNSPLHRTVMLMVTLTGAFLFFATGGLIIETWYNAANATGYLIGAGIIAFLNGFVYLGDFALTSFKFG